VIAKPLMSHATEKARARTFPRVERGQLPARDHDNQRQRDRDC
jgi:hypothetical protein